MSTDLENGRNVLQQQILQKAATHIYRGNTMSTDLENQRQRNVLQQQITDSLQKADGYGDKLKRTNSRYGIANIILGALATFATAQAVFSGHPPGGWKFTCTVASVFALGATITAGVQRQLADPDLIVEASECIGKLKSLKVETITSTYNPEEVEDKYQQLLEEFTKVDC